MNRIHIPTSKHHIKHTTNGPKYHSSLESKYRSHAVRKLIDALEKNEPIPIFYILSAMYMLNKAWDEVFNQTFINCFKKSEISQKDAEEAINEEVDPFKGLGDEEFEDVEEDVMQTLNADLSVLKERFAEQIDTDITTDDYVNFDIEVTTSHARLTTADLIAKVIGTQQQTEADEENRRRRE